ncbi:hypothetical protein EZV62_003981 [Acer yangbiense]|uniref:Uncharacterized protein n=1 Tax=Acer yangbiense TaxID=1000413 RepID=A0A5C7IKR5_9ROSI|nr:hypothetical protein EZV62_003981 [Acer yangbiense]
MEVVKWDMEVNDISWLNSYVVPVDLGWISKKLGLHKDDQETTCNLVSSMENDQSWVYGPMAEQLKSCNLEGPMVVDQVALKGRGLASSNLVVGRPDDIVGNIQCNRPDRGDSSFSGTEVGLLVKVGRKQKVSQVFSSIKKHVMKTRNDIISDSFKKRNVERIPKSLIHKTEKWNLEVKVAKDSQAESESEPEKEKEKRSSPEGRFWAFTNLKTQPQATV